MIASDFIAELALATKEQIAAVVTPLVERIAVLEAQLAAAPAVDIIAAKAALLVPKPLDGRHADPVDLEAIAAKAALLVPRPRDGQDAAPVDVDAIAVKAAALIPRPADGKDALPVDVDDVAIKAALLVQPGRDGRDGKDVDPEALSRLRSEVASVNAAIKDYKSQAAEFAAEFPAKMVTAVEQAIKSIPAPKDGKDGRDVDEQAVALLVKSAVTEAVSAIPLPKDGRDGRDVDAVLLETVVAASVDRVVSAWERPVDGKSVTLEDVAPLIEAEVAKAVKSLPAAKDGRGILYTSINRDGELEVTFSDGGREKVGIVVGAPGAPGKDADMDALRKHAEDLVDRIPKPKDGAPGKDGLDGLGFDDADLVIDEEKGVTFKWANADRVKERPLPIPFHRGIYRAGTSYRKGAMVTAQGSLWMALQDTSDRPNESKAWVLIVKRGRDGKDAPPRDGDV